MRSGMVIQGILFNLTTKTKRNPYNQCKTIRTTRWGIIIVVTDTKQTSYMHNIILIRLSKAQSQQTVNRIEMHLEKTIQHFSTSNYNKTQKIPTLRSSQTDGTFLSG